MVEVAASVAPTVAFDGVTAEFGQALITEPVALGVAADAVEALAPRLREYDAVIVAAYGDPGHARLARALAPQGRPLSGLAETGQALVRALPHPKVATEAAGPRGVTQRSTPSPLVMIGNVRLAVRTASCRSRRERFGGPAGGRICVV